MIVSFIRIGSVSVTARRRSCGKVSQECVCSQKVWVGGYAWSQVSSGGVGTRPHPGTNT